MAGASLTSAQLDPEYLGFARELFALVDREVAGEWAHERSVAVGGLGLRFKFAGESLRDAFEPAFGHLGPGEGAGRTLEILFADGAEGGVWLPSPPWGPDDHRERGRIRGLFGDGVYAVAGGGAGSVSILDVPRGRALYWRAEPDPPWYERASPIHTVLGLWAAANDRQLLHGAATGGPDGAVLIVGPSGSGKSSTILACLDRSELGILADDYCLAETTDEGTRLYCTHGSSKALPDALERMPGLAPLVLNPGYGGSEKAVLDLSRRAPERLLHTAPLRAILVPEITGRPESSLAPISGAAALRALAPSTILQIPGGDGEAMGRTAAVAARCPAFRLEAGTDPDRLVATISELLAG